MNCLITMLSMLSVMFSCFSFNVFSQNATVEAYPDNSFTIEEYQYQNIPSPSKNWYANDIKAFIKFMGKIYHEDKWSLPRKDSPYSGKLFTKMVDKNNLSPINDKNIPIENRINDLDIYMEYSNFIISIYKENHQKTERFGKEVLSSFIYLIYTAQSVRIFFDELKTSLPKSTTQSRDFQAVYDNSTQQLADMMHMTLLTFEKDAIRYDYADLSVFASDTYQTVSENWSYLTKTQQEKLMSTINILQGHTNSVVAAEMKKLYKTLNKV